MSIYTVDDMVNFFVGDRIPNAWVLALKEALYPGIIRLAGGMGKNGKIQEYFDVAFAGLNGFFLWSGATRFTEENGELADSVAEVVARQGQLHPGLVTGGSAPRTGRFEIRGESTLYLGDHTFVNPKTRWVTVIQRGPEDGVYDPNDSSSEQEGALKWNGDLQAYFKWMDNARKFMNFNLGIVEYNAGGVSLEEAQLALDYNIPLFVVEGSGRHCNDTLLKAPFLGPNVYHVGLGLSQAHELRIQLMANGLSN